MPAGGGSSERYSFSTKYAATTDTGQLNANAYLITNFSCSTIWPELTNGPFL
jgi:hypothetical protein